ncbi:CPBP family intramembrane glutamic endopeptidase [Pseudoalteromonas sp. SG43-3]|uniref:CPBP family intramembrane glutamic endopeptidase n=1 Tax=Pseudoalteromonas sp. SG43-3 TaxID=2760970 RepID=UPI001602B754|nr:CPBP family intramembrane metalloprotease [Pseudoalteromonas sp. SG43-3]
MLKLIVECCYIFLFIFLSVISVYFFDANAPNSYYSIIMYLSMIFIIILNRKRLTPIGWGVNPFNKNGGKLILLCFFSIYLLDRILFYFSSISNYSLEPANNNLFYTLVLAPILEELLFRGVVFFHYCKVVGVKSSALISSALFTVVHFGLDIFGLISIFISGLIFCYLTYKVKGGIYLALTLHVLINIVSL